MRARPDDASASAIRERPVECHAPNEALRRALVRGKLLEVVGAGRRGMKNWTAEELPMVFANCRSAALRTVKEPLEGALQFPASRSQTVFIAKQPCYGRRPPS